MCAMWLLGPTKSSLEEKSDEFKASQQDYVFLSKLISFSFHYLLNKVSQ